MNFYTNVFVKGNYIFVRGYENNKLIEKKIKYEPYLFVPKKGGKYTTLNGIDVDKIEFNSISDAKDFIETYKDVSNFDIYGLTQFQYTYINDTYYNEIRYDPSLISIVSLDIECKSDEGFPNIDNADKEITAITIRKNGKSYVFGCGEFTTTDKNITYIKCKNEEILLAKFIEVWNFKSIKPDIITGWNIDFFDIPYLVNRINNILGESFVKKLSPWGLVDPKEIMFRGKTNKTYILQGITSLDYLQLYMKFKFGNQESYKLDYIAQEELGVKKIDYSEYGSLQNLYINNYQKFIEYNIHDTILVDKLEEKLGFIQLVLNFAYDAKVNYIDTMATVRPWDIIIHNYLINRRIVIPQQSEHKMDSSLVGGYVKEPKIGMSKWVVSFDLNSLYPHLIIQYNISPETFVGKINNFKSIDDIINSDISFSDKEYVVSGNGCMYSKKKLGFLPALMEKMYNDRNEYKKKMNEAKKKYEKTKDKELEKVISRYHNLQLAKKIQLNSAYGALGNIHFRWFDFNHAEAITLSGQLSIKWIEKNINEYINKILKTKGIDYVIASDTDSIYITLENLVNQTDETDEKKIVEMIDTFCESKIQPFINKCYKNLAIKMNAYSQKMIMKRETIANKGIWKAKKMYILNAWNIEGVQYDEPKLKIQGIEAVRSSTPQICRNAIKDCLNIIMNKTEDDLIEYINNFREKFNISPIKDLASPRGVNGLNKYYDDKSVYILGTPIHVKGSLIFNNLIKKYNIKSFPNIQDGDKVKFIYLKMPNSINEESIAFIDELPKEFNLDKYIDRDKQFEKTFIKPLKSITSVIGWKTEYKSTLEEFFK